MDYVIRGIDRRPEKATVLSDASWKPQPPRLHGRGHVAFFVFPPNGASMLAASPVPDRILAKLAAIKPRETYITSFEIMALCGVKCSIPYDQIRGAVFSPFRRQLGGNFFFSSLKGSSPSPDAALMISAYNLQLARAGARSWIDYVSIEAQIS